MNFITEPSIYLVGRQVVEDNEVNKFLSDYNVETWTTDTDVAGEKLLEVAGRLCYMSFSKPRPGGNKAYTEHILECAHGSVLEHSVYNFIITGVSRSFTHELVRHRSGWGYSQLSQRYVDESTADFVVPPDLKEEVEEYLRCQNDSSPMTDKGKIGGLWCSSMQLAQKSYKELADYLVAKQKETDLTATDRRKNARQAARSVLPNACETKIFCTANARAIRHFLEMRGALAADKEIASVAIKLLRIMQKESPNIFADYEIHVSEQGREYIVGKYRKV
jgi:thymidylate synthase (FAD)